MSGDIFSFVSKLFNLSLSETIRKLNMDFCLNLDLDNPPSISKKRIKQVEQENQLLGAFEIWEAQAFKTLCDYLSLLEYNQRIYAPQTPADMDNPNRLFVEACHKTGYVEYSIDILIFGSFEDKLKFFKTRRGEVVNIANELQKRVAKQPA